MTEPNYAVAPGEYLEEWIDDIDPRMIAHEITDALLADVDLSPEESR